MEIVLKTSCTQLYERKCSFTVWAYLERDFIIKMHQLGLALKESRGRGLSMYAHIQRHSDSRVCIHTNTHTPPWDCQVAVSQPLPCLLRGWSCKGRGKRRMRSKSVNESLCSPFPSVESEPCGHPCMSTTPWFLILLPWMLPSYFEPTELYLPLTSHHLSQTGLPRPSGD